MSNFLLKMLTSFTYYCNNIYFAFKNTVSLFDDFCPMVLNYSKITCYMKNRVILKITYRVKQLVFLLINFFTEILSGIFNIFFNSFITS